MTKMRDNFSNPNPFLSQVKNYQDLVNQPHWAEPLADSFKQLGNQPAKGPQQRGSNALMSGFASGIQGAVNKERQDRLSPILEQAGQITAKAAELEAQSQQEQARQFAIQEYGRKYTPLVATFADLVDKGDPRSSIVFEDLISKAGSIPGYENLKAERWDATTGTGWALNTKTGEYRKITADEIISVIAPSAQAIYGERWFEKFLPLNAGVAKDAQYAFNTNREETELGLTKKRADIANTYSQAKVHNKQAEKISHEMDNPPMSEKDKFDYQETRKSNEKMLEGLQEEIKKIDPETKILVLNRFEEILTSGGAGFGGTPKDAFVRWVKQKFGEDADIQEARMLQKYFFPEIKGVAGNPNLKEWDDLISRIISGEQNVESALNIIEFERNKAQRILDKYTGYSKALIDTEHKLPYYHPDITARLKSPINDNKNENNDKNLGIVWD